MANLSRGAFPAQVLKKAAEKKELVQVALNTHGTRAVQKLIETLTTREQVRSLDLCCCQLTALHVHAPESPLYPSCPGSGSSVYMLAHSILPPRQCLAFATSC